MFKLISLGANFALIDQIGKLYTQHSVAFEFTSGSVITSLSFNMPIAFVRIRTQTNVVFHLEVIIP